MKNAEEKKTKTVTHHIVYSTKGGCGKTAFSLFLSLSDNFSQTEQSKEVFIPTEVHYKSGKHYFVDLDLLGSSLEYYLHINKSEDKLAKEHPIQTPTLQELTNGEKYIYDIKDLNDKDRLKKQMVFVGCYTKSATTRSDGINQKVYIIPVGASEKEKAMFHVKKGTTPLLRYEELEAQLNEIQQSILIHNDLTDNDDNIHFIYDLAPNADSYTDAVINEIFDRVRKNEKEKIIMYLVSNSKEMLKCNIDWLNRFLCGNKKMPCAVVLVNNDNVGEFGNVIAGTAAIKNVIDELDCGRDVMDLIKSHFFFMKDSISMTQFRYNKDDEKKVVTFNPPESVDSKKEFDVGNMRKDKLDMMTFTFE